MAMEVLYGLCDAVSLFGEVIGRSDEKDMELACLSSTVRSISESLKSFVESMSPDERLRVFQSNQIFGLLMQHLRQCEQIKQKRMPDPGVRSLADSNGHSNGRGFQERGALATIRSGLDGLKRKSMSTLEKTQSLFHEGTQALSGKVGGSVAQLLKLPDDELELIRQSSRELTRLVPLLTLAINAANAKHGSDEDRRAEKRRRCSVESASTVDVKQLEDAEPPKLRMQLVSDHKDSSKIQLPEISASELRPDPEPQRPGSWDTPATARRIFGRKEVSDKVSKDLTLTQAGKGMPQPLNKFVSRDSLLVEVLEPPPDPARPTLEEATMVFGGIDDDLGATLALGGADEDSLGAPQAPASLAVVRGISKNGLHVRNLGDTRWSWFPKDDPVMLKAGDRIGVLLESPPGSSIPGPPRHLEADEVTCLLGIELLDPSAVPSDAGASQAEGRPADDDERSRELRVTRTRTLSPLRDSN